MISLWLYKNILAPSYHAILHIFSTPVFFIGLGIILVLERLFPAKPSQKILSVGFVQDTVWLLLESVFEVVLVASYVGFLGSIYKRHFDFLTIQVIQTYRRPIRYMIWILAIDFLAWFHHWVRHKVPWFWYFHTVHHSQREINLFTDVRYHAFEYIIAKTIDTFPLLILGSNIYTVIYYVIFERWFSRFYHANIRSNLGFLRYVFVTPQSHRIHHSIEKPHYDKNFGNLFSIWDQIFRTQYRGWEEYPDTGIPDKHFPVDKIISPVDLILTPIRQHLYPFQAIARSLKRIPSR